MSIAIFFPVEQTPRHLATANTPTCPTQNPLFPASKLAGYDPTDVFKSLSSPAVITWDLGSIKNINCVSLLSEDIDSSATILIETSPNATTWTTRSNKAFWAHLNTAVAMSSIGEDQDPGIRYNQRNFSFWYSATPISARYVRATVTGTLPWTLSRLFVGRSFVPEGSFQYGSSFEFIDTGVKDRTERGAPVMDPGISLTNAKIKLDFVTKDEMYKYLYALNHWRQTTRDLLVCLDVNDQTNFQRNLVYGTLSNGRQIVMDSFNRYSQELVIESL